MSILFVHDNWQHNAVLFINPDIAETQCVLSILLTKDVYMAHVDDLKATIPTLRWIYFDDMCFKHISALAQRYLLD